MKYEKTPIKKPVRTKLTKEIEQDNLSKYSTLRIIWHLLKKHHTALLVLLVILSWAVSFSRFLDRI